MMLAMNIPLAVLCMWYEQQIRYASTREVAQRRNLLLKRDVPKPYGLLRSNLLLWVELSTKPFFRFSCSMVIGSPHDS